MNAIEPTTEIQPDKIAEKFAKQERHFLDLEENIRIGREFFAKHVDALAPFEWTYYGWDREVTFVRYCKDKDAKAIARAFGADGWKRKTDGYTCGSINWSKEVDGLTLVIKGAESIMPKLIEEVKLS
jgi:hypothetical protein